MGGGLKAAREGSQSALKIAGGALHTAGGPGGGSTPSAVMPQPRARPYSPCRTDERSLHKGRRGRPYADRPTAVLGSHLLRTLKGPASTSAPRLAQTLCHPCPAADGPIVTAVLEASTPREEP